MIVDRTHINQLFSTGVDRRAWGMCWACLLCFVCLLPAGIIAAEVEQPPALTHRITELIAQLGSDSYATRRQAQGELEKIGVPALDQLREAMLNPDPQIAAASRYLIRSSYIRWTNESDALSVRKLLDQYGTGDLTFRAERIQRLASLENDLGLMALLRIARYEASIDLSKQAALLIMDHPSGGDVTKEDKRWEAIYEASRQGSNTACTWLTTWAEKHVQSKPADAEYWQSTIDFEFDLLAKKSSETSRNIISDFIRFIAKQLIQDQQHDAALRIAKNLLKIEYRDRERLPMTTDLYAWSLDNHLPELVMEHYDATGRKLFEGSRYEYLVAEAQRAINQEELAKETSLRAFRRNQVGFPNNAYDRLNVGKLLNSRMQYDWAEREYREILSTSDIHDPIYATAAFKLALMLADGHDFKAAAESLRPLIEAIDQDPVFTRELDSDQRQLGINIDQTVSNTQRFRSMYLYYRAKGTIDENRPVDAKNDLREALKNDPENVDILITMSKLNLDENWNKQVEKAKTLTLRRYRDALSKLEKALHNSSPGDVSTYKDFYSVALNTYAWLLVSLAKDEDIEDKQTALRCSELACRMQPESAPSLDTLARCYFALGNIRQAIQVQKRAIKYEPYSRELTSSLAEFEAALK